jgi:osmoprotectant transport system ATP-binding protein
VDELESFPVDAKAGDARLTAYGHTFDVNSDSLRAALDATVLSPAGQAAGVDDLGRVVGVTSYDRLRAAILAGDAESQKAAATEVATEP